jgi:hypothetical protein
MVAAADKRRRLTVTIVCAISRKLRANAPFSSLIIIAFSLSPLPLLLLPNHFYSLVRRRRGPSFFGNLYSERLWFVKKIVQS